MPFPACSFLRSTCQKMNTCFCPSFFLFMIYRTRSNVENEKSQVNSCSSATCIMHFWVFRFYWAVPPNLFFLNRKVFFYRWVLPPKWVLDRSLWSDWTNRTVNATPPGQKTASSSFQTSSRRDGPSILRAFANSIAYSVTNMNLAAV